MNDMPMMTPAPTAPPPGVRAPPERVRDPAPTPVARSWRWAWVPRAGVAVGATALAQAATSSGPARSQPGHVTASDGSSTTTTAPGRPHPFGGRMHGGFGAGGGFGGHRGSGRWRPFIYGEFTIKGPNGYETLSERTGTVSDVTDTSGSTWSLTVKSADGTSGTFTVDSGTSVNGGEMGIGSVKTGRHRAGHGRGVGWNLDGQAGHRPDRAAGQRRARGDRRAPVDPSGTRAPGGDLGTRTPTSAGPGPRRPNGSGAGSAGPAGGARGDDG